MKKACSRCGRIHEYGEHCRVNRSISVTVTNERKIRNTARWARKAVEVKEKANWLCEVCLDENRLTYEGLETHHIEKLKDNTDKAFDDNNLICLCVYHHKQADKGLLKKEYLRDLVRRREQNNSPRGV